MSLLVKLLYEKGLNHETICGSLNIDVSIDHFESQFVLFVHILQAGENKKQIQNRLKQDDYDVGQVQAARVTHPLLIPS